MIRRKNSFGFIDFMRGKYIYNNVEHLQIMVDEMSVLEKEQIKLHDFNTLWRSMWGIKEAETDPVETNDNTSKNIQYKSEEIASQKKFDNLKAGIQLGENTELINLGNLIDNSSTKWKETEWEFPKGRRNYQERDLDCALREFEEETGLSKHNIKIIENIMPFEEIFLGSNHKSYKHKYFLAYTDIETDELDKYQETEVSKLDWKTLDECLESIRPYNLEKKQLIININKVLEEYRLY
jgi:8-oxo-dGTP pyrophosphatase MutT (NUDIX family)